MGWEHACSSNPRNQGHGVISCECHACPCMQFLGSLIGDAIAQALVQPEPRIQLAVGREAAVSWRCECWWPIQDKDVQLSHVQPSHLHYFRGKRILYLVHSLPEYRHPVPSLGPGPLLKCVAQAVPLPLCRRPSARRSALPLVRPVGRSGGALLVHGTVSDRQAGSK